MEVQQCNKCVTLVGGIDNEEGYTFVGAGGMWEVSVSLFTLL